MFWKGLAILAIFATIDLVSGYGKGAPKDACVTMIPQHKVDPQTSTSPYRITVNKKSIRAGDKVQVTISGSKSAKDFQGFFVQARIGDTPVGKFEKTEGVNLVDCGTGTATGATHTKPDTKEKIVLTWIAPPSTTETVRFRATVAQNGGVFWVGQLSSPLYVKSN